jgi:hypothetical protein
MQASIVGNYPLVNRLVGNYPFAFPPPRGQYPTMADEESVEESVVNRLTSAIEQAKRAGRSDAGISVAAGLGRTFVRDFMDRRQTPSVKNAIKLCRALGIAPATLFDEGHVSDEDIAFQMESKAIRSAMTELLALDPHDRRVILSSLRAQIAIAKRNPPGGPLPAKVAPVRQKRRA